MPRKRQENAVQMMRIVDAHSPLQDRWLTTACASSGGRCCGTGEGVFACELAASWRIRIECRCGNGSACGMGSGAGSRPVQSREEVERRETAFVHFESHVPGFLSQQHAKPDELAESLEQGKRHLEFACSLAEVQIEQGGRALFEYPLAASEESLWKLRSIDGMRCVRCDQCQFGTTSVDNAGTWDRRARAQGSWRMMSTSRRP